MSLFEDVTNLKVCKPFKFLDGDNINLKFL